MLKLRGVFKAKKLCPRYIGPYQIIERIGEVAYRLALPPSMSGMHNVFHVSQLRKFVPDSSVTVDLEAIELEPNMTFQPQPIQIVDRDMRNLRNRSISVVKVVWEGSPDGEATWELESEMLLQGARWAINSSLGERLPEASSLQPAMFRMLLRRAR
ncbi:hypothetical protein A2U01_0032083 [Trifolium medium]|uniref:Tf2-1-like SH3-like domain-containing protein n=1 Tax=Trifolium medium TaxID=97028 RepID=A0A392PJA3_9FABA|nr:hypothetical protein [Trifolium medium]